MRITSSSLGGSGNSSPGASASSGMPGPVPASVSLIGLSLGPVLIFSLSSAMAHLLLCAMKRASAWLVPKGEGGDEQGDREGAACLRACLSGRPFEIALA